MFSQKAKAFCIESLLKNDREPKRTFETNHSSSPVIGSACQRLESACQRLERGCQRLGSGTPCYHNSVQIQTDPFTGCDIRAELCHSDLWEAFHALGTEMIITKTGRRMFPALRVKLEGLRPEARYRVSLHFVPVDHNKYRYVYHSSKWMVSGPGDSMLPGQSYDSSDSPVLGSHLANQVVSFERIKLTNSNTPKEGQISLVSMQRFQPHIHVKEVSTNTEDCKVRPPTGPPDGVVFVFPQTSFMAVTAYQNQEITRLKIARNPFAKGFREAGKTRSSLDTIMASFGFTMASTSAAFEPVQKKRIEQVGANAPLTTRLYGQTTTPDRILPPCTYGHREYTEIPRVPSAEYCCLYPMRFDPGLYAMDLPNRTLAASNSPHDRGDFQLPELISSRQKSMAPSRTFVEYKVHNRCNFNTAPTKEECLSGLSEGDHFGSSGWSMRGISTSTTCLGKRRYGQDVTNILTV